MPIKLEFPPLRGFETIHAHHHTSFCGRMIFNALRIASYIPIISCVGTLIAIVDAFRFIYKNRQFDQRIVNCVSTLIPAKRTVESMINSVESVCTSIDNLMSRAIQQGDNDADRAELCQAFKDQINNGVRSVDRLSTEAFRWGNSSMLQIIDRQTQLVEELNNVTVFVKKSREAFNEVMNSKMEDNPIETQIAECMEIIQRFISSFRVLEPEQAMFKRIRQHGVESSNRKLVEIIGLGILYLRSDIKNTAWSPRSVIPL